MVSFFHIVDPFFLPSPGMIVLSFAKLLGDGILGTNIMMTLWRVLCAFMIALILGIPLGLLLGWSKSVYTHFEGVIDFFRSIPATAMFPLFLLVFGVGDNSKIAVAAFSSTIIIIFNTAHGIRYAKQSRIHAARLMGASKLQMFQHIYFWESLPQIFVGIRTSISLSVIIIVITEMFVGTTFGVGKLIVDFQYSYEIPAMYAIILCVGFMGYLLNLILVALETRLIHWNGK